MAFAVPFRADTEFLREAKPGEGEEKSRAPGGPAARKEGARSEVPHEAGPGKDGAGPRRARGAGDKFGATSTAGVPQRAAVMEGSPAFPDLSLRPHMSAQRRGTSPALHGAAGHAADRRGEVPQSDAADGFHSKEEEDKNSSKTTGKVGKRLDGFELGEGAHPGVGSEGTGGRGGQEEGPAGREEDSRGDGAGGLRGASENERGSAPGAPAGAREAGLDGPAGAQALAPGIGAKAAGARAEPSAGTTESGSRKRGRQSEAEDPPAQGWPRKAVDAGAMDGAEESSDGAVWSDGKQLNAAPDGEADDTEPVQGTQSADNASADSAAAGSGGGLVPSESGGIDGIFRTVGITRRRTRPNRMSSRTGKVTHPMHLGACPTPATQKGGENGESERNEDCAAKAGPEEANRGQQEDSATGKHGAEGGDEKHEEDGRIRAGRDIGQGRAESASHEREGEGEDEEDEDSVLAARVKHEGRDRRQKAKKKREEDDVMYWDWAPPALRGAGDDGSEDMDVTNGVGPDGKGGNAGRYRKRKGSHGSLEALPEQTVGRPADEGRQEGVEEMGAEDEEHTGTQDKPKGKGRGRPRSSGPVAEVKGAAKAAEQAEPMCPAGAGVGLPAPAGHPESSPAQLTLAPCPTPSPPPPVPLSLQPPLQLPPLRNRRASPTPPSSAAPVSLGPSHVRTNRAPAPTMTTRHRDPSVVPAAERGSQDAAQGSRVIRSRRVQERVARAEGDKDKSHRGQRPLHISVTLTKDEISQDFLKILGHRKTSRPKRSNTAALGLALCSNLTTPNWSTTY